MDDLDNLDATVQRSDPDRWLASRFVADEARRADLVALYALNDELARIAPAVSQPLLGEIRLAWWSEALDEVFAGGAVRRHPVVEALAVAVRRRNLSRAPFDAMIEARHLDLEPGPLSEGEALDRYIDGTAGAAMALAVAIVAGADGLGTRAAARAWALAGLWRAERLDLPDVRRPVAAALVEARTSLKGLPVEAFPAVAYVTLAGPYARGRDPSPLEKRLRLLAAVARGRL